MYLSCNRIAQTSALPARCMADTFSFLHTLSSGIKNNTVLKIKKDLPEDTHVTTSCRALTAILWNVIRGICFQKSLPQIYGMLDSNRLLWSQMSPWIFSFIARFACTVFFFSFSSWSISYSHKASNLLKPSFSVLSKAFSFYSVILQRRVKSKNALMSASSFLSF